MMRVVSLVLVLLVACGDNVRGRITIGTPDVWSPALAEFVALTPYSDLSLGQGGEIHIEVVDDATIPLEGYRIDRGAHITVAAHDVLGAQYGVAAALEDLGFRFRHPFDTARPWVPTDRGGDGAVHAPQIRVRGMQLHTLHPIEGYFAFWEPSPENTQDAHRIIDWLIKNRGNFLQWVALDDIMDPARHAAWQPFTREIIDYAHMRGVRVGINIQLFGKSNLQLAFDLSDSETIPLETSIAQRLPLITNELPFDVYELSFGEFFNAEPQKFIDSTNEVASQLRTFAPQAEMHAAVHVGATQRVTYRGQELLYYFLVQYADPSIIPDIHTTMYYNLYDDSGGAYQHDDFSEHRQYLLDRICANERAAYFPETAYWVAFDNSVPMYLPLYVYSRQRDLAGLAADGCGNPLDNHLLFSTGWEWGYWLNDYTALRASYELATPQALVDHAFGDDLAPAAPIVGELIAEQKRAYIDQRLTGYLVGRDIAIDAGDKLDPPIISQPDRVTFEDLELNPAIDLEPVLALLRAHEQVLADLNTRLEDLDLPVSNWSRELRDGFAVNRLRVRFVLATYSAVLAHLRGESGDAHYTSAQEILETAREIIEARHAELHDPHDRRLVDKTTNYTFYQFGYLYMADILCYWQRELDQVGNILGNTSAVPNTCLF